MAKMSEKKKLERVFNTYIKLRDCPDGIGRCISCSKIITYPSGNSSVHASHLYPRSVVYNSLWFHPMNVHASCDHCNVWLGGNIMAYREGLIRRYGESVIEELEQARAAGQGRKWYDHDYIELRKYYSKKVREMKKERGI
jgi:hypothetical protein